MSADDEHLSPSTAASQARRASARLVTVGREALTVALTPERVRATFGTKLVAVGLGLVCLAGGVDYSAHSDEIDREVAGFAVQEGQGRLVDTAREVGDWVDGLKRAAVAWVPASARGSLALLAFLPGVAALAWGVRLRVVTAGDDRARARGLRDVGWVLLGPGLLGALAFGVGSWNGRSVLRNTSRGFVDALRDGRLSGADLLSLARRYAPWAWTEEGALLVLGVALGVTWAATGRHVRGRLWSDVARRTAGVGAVLCLADYALVSLVAIVTYGGGLSVIVWPWKVRPGPFLVMLGFMALGGGLLLAGFARQRAAAKASGAAP